MDPFTIGLIAISILGAGGTAYEHSQKKKAQEEADRAAQNAREAEEKARRANEAQLKQFWDTVTERSKSLKLLLDKAIESGKVDNIQVFAFWGATIHELIDIKNKNRNANTIKDISQADQNYLDRLKKYLNKEMNSTDAESFQKEVMQMHESVVIDYFYNYVEANYKAKKRELLNMKRRLASVKVEINDLISKEEVENVDHQYEIAALEKQKNSLTGQIEELPGKIERVEFLLVVLKKVSNKTLTEVVQNNEINRAYNLLLKYLKNDHFNAADLKFLNHFVLKYKSEMAA